MEPDLDDLLKGRQDRAREARRERDVQVLSLKNRLRWHRAAVRELELVLALMGETGVDSDEDTEVLADSAGHLDPNETGRDDQSHDTISSV